MTRIVCKGIVQGGQIIVAEPINLPDGSEVTITSQAYGNFVNDEDKSVREVTMQLGDIEFMTEEEQSDDPEAVQQWIDDLRAIPPVPVDPEREAEWRAWSEKMRQFNVEAMRKQFEEGTS
jgi:hypothetical protein